MNWADATDETAIEILEWLRDRISHIKMPRALDFHPKLPRTDAGKLYKRHLVDEYRGGARSDERGALRRGAGVRRLRPTVGCAECTLP
jgi:fatty-acyl-CoA synthase